jgi:hypothetical protein
VSSTTLGMLQIVATILSGIDTSAPAVAYHDLRVGKEGVSTEELAAVFE